MGSQSPVCGLLLSCYRENCCTIDFLVSSAIANCHLNLQELGLILDILFPRELSASFLFQELRASSPTVHEVLMKISYQSA